MFNELMDLSVEKKSHFLVRFFLHTLFFLFLVTQICFAQWYPQNSSTTKSLNAVQFLDANYGWAVGDSGLIIHTTNGGTDWILQSSETTNELLSVFFTDANTGTVVGDRTILRTTNGGASWTLQQPGVFGFKLQSVYFINSNIGTAVGGRPSMIAWTPLILHTTNGGESWIEQTIEIAFVLSKVSGTDDNQGIPVPLYGVCFTDTNTGTIVGTWGILHTTNGGNNWTRNASDTTSWLCSVCFTDAKNGTMVGGDGIIRRTTNGGLDWILQSSGTTNWLNSVCFTDANTGTAVGWDGIILRTTNGGTDWILQSGGTEIIALNGVSFTDPNTGTAVGYDGIILRTTNGGVVPVELTSFTTTANGKEVTLNWSTATELNNQGFEVQRKFDGNDFVTIGSVKGHGTTTSPNNYTFVDKLTDAGKYSYRLKQIDYGGKYEYSQTVEVNWSPFTTFKLEQNYPNPFNPSTTINWQLPVGGDVTLKVYDVLGNEIAILVNEEKEAGSYEIEFDAENLTSGVYFYQLKSGSFVETKKLLLLR